MADGMRPRWSPDGRWIVFERPVDDVGTVELWRVRPDGSAVERLGQGSAVEFSPDGGRLAFVGDGGVWTMAIDGSEASRAIPATFVEGLAWSPDGTSLFVASNYGGGEATGLSIVRIDGATPAITGIAAQGHAPSWQPLLLDARLGR